MEFQAEPFSRWCREAVERGLFEAHWREVGRYRDRIALEPDFEKFALLERAQVLACYTARKEGILTAYAMFICSPALHAKSHVFAFCDAIYVAREQRGPGVGKRLIELAERELIARGVAKIVYHFKTAQDQGALLRSLGYEAAETLYEKLVI